jgi:hypothetical protein
MLWEQNNILRKQDIMLWEQISMLWEQDIILREQNIFHPMSSDFKCTQIVKY